MKNENTGSGAASQGRHARPKLLMDYIRSVDGRIGPLGRVFIVISVTAFIVCALGIVFVFIDPIKSLDHYYWMTFIFVHGFIALFLLCLVFMRTNLPCQNKDCGAIISSDLPWVCGTCKSIQDGKKSKLFGRLGCSNPACRASPQVFFCPHCSTPIFLSREHAVKPYAFLCGETDPSEQVEALYQAGLEAAKKKRYTQRVKQFEEIEFKTQLARRLTEQFKTEMELWETKRQYTSAKASWSPPKQTEEERLKRDLDRKQEGYLLAKRIAEKARQKAAEEWKDSPDLLDDNYMVIKDWLEERIH
jgi:hypothetical protein